MGAHYRDTLLSAFESVEGPGRFNFEGGLLGAFGPLEVDGLGSISLPLLPQQAEALAKLCSQASAQGRYASRRLQYRSICAFRMVHMEPSALSHSVLIE